MTKTIFCLLITSVLMIGNLTGQSPKEAQVAAAVETLRKAMVDPDRMVLEKITLDQLAYGHSSGKVQTKAEFIESLTSGQSDFVKIDLTDQTISVLDKTAVVRHILTAESNDNGKPGNVKIAVITVWHYEKGAWKLWQRQAVKLL